MGVGGMSAMSLRRRDVLERVRTLGSLDKYVALGERGETSYYCCVLATLWRGDTVLGVDRRPLIPLCPARMAGRNARETADMASNILKSCCTGWQTRENKNGDQEIQLSSVFTYGKLSRIIYSCQRQRHTETWDEGQIVLALVANAAKEEGTRARCSSRG